jgi:hypothetical protein
LFILTNVPFESHYLTGEAGGVGGGGGGLGILVLTVPDETSMQLPQGSHAAYAWVLATNNPANTNTMRNGRK